MICWDTLKYQCEKVNSKYPKRGTSQSATEYSLSLKKTSHRYHKILTPPKLGPQKTMSIIVFRIALTLDVKIVWFGRQVSVCVQKRHKNAIFACSWFQKFNFDCLLLRLLISSPTTENILKFVCPLLTQSSIMISGTKGYLTLFLAFLVTNPDVRSKIKKKKKLYLRSLLFYTNF